MDEPMIKSIREFFLNCPVLEAAPVNVDYSPNNEGYTIELLPGDPVYREYVDGMCIYQQNYIFTSKQAYGPDVLAMIANSGLIEKLALWVKEQSKAGNFPQIEGHRVQSHKMTSSGYLYTVDTDLAQYQCQFRILYT